MGYGSFETPRGLAGYNVADVCHAEGCAEKIDRGLAYLCGDQPGRSSEFGCGWWFCGGHLFAAPVQDSDGTSCCGSCSDSLERQQAEETAADLGGAR